MGGQPRAGDAHKAVEPRMTEGPLLVLHVEDDAAVRASVAALLKTEGHAVHSVVDGESAVELVQRQCLQPDVLIIDFNLPGDMDGAETAEAICGAVGHSIPMLLLTGELTQAGLPWLPGVPLFCASKPMDPDLLLRVVESFAALGRFARRHRE